MCAHITELTAAAISVPCPLPSWVRQPPCPIQYTHESSRPQSAGTAVVCCCTAGRKTRVIPSRFLLKSGDSGAPLPISRGCRVAVLLYRTHVTSPHSYASDSEPRLTTDD